MSRQQVRSLNRQLAASRPEDARREALLQLLERSIRLGHRRLAIRRILMLHACAIEVPKEWSGHCRELLLRAERAELSRIHQSVHEWAMMLAPLGMARKKQR